MTKGLSLLLVDDDDAFRESLGAELRRSGHKVEQASSCAQALSKALSQAVELVILDLKLPDGDGMETLGRIREANHEVDVIVLTGHGSVETAVRAMKLGAVDYLAKPCDLDELDIVLERAAERRSLIDRNLLLQQGLGAFPTTEEMVGSSPEFRSVLAAVERVARTEASALIRGESGVGKECVARRIHALSRRNGHPFVVLDCAALNENLLQSELFGHQAGAFTGAVRTRHGLFEVADGGTLFLDEIGELSPSVQAALLRVIETGVFRRLGGTAEIRTDARIVSATNRPVEKMGESTFRRDLYYRLSAVTIEIAPLRERREDILVLTDHFVERHNLKRGKRRELAPQVKEALLAHDWPGNVRELAHAIERALLFSDEDLLGTESLPPYLFRSREASGAQPLAEPMRLEEMEKRHIRAVLERCDGHRAWAAEILGISERTLYRKIRSLGIALAIPGHRP